ncbi:hypothetical protein [Spirillospora sp. NPDC047279]|uniref:hypothetical protein n=1 Tax=Spirillospora sp. NPDC047279 TaxID=3155478 RepID=UPI00340BAAC1
MADEAAVGVMEETDEPKPEDKAKPKPEAEAEPKPEPEDKAKPEDKTKAEPEDKPEDKVKTQDEAASEDESEPDEEPEPERKKEARARARPRTSARVRERDPVRDPVGVVAIVLVSIAALAALWSGWSWYGAEHDDSLAYSRLRDQALQSGEQAVQNLNTLDYRTLDASLRSWQDSTTGKMNSDIVQGRATFEQQTQQAKTVTRARILESAITELDAHAGRARVIVAVEIVVTPPSGAPATKRDRHIAELTRTSAGWKVSALGPAPVGNS